ncbi:hypothetical protein BJ965_005551 [Streptomyces luteogriseus]|uniref:Lipoprotein n=1 Tax=Streptomyces luteogriseus TaxID=68233 RepID=A0A7W7GJW5_9ACTN|nr:hypothetical protein [Streptomyces luteogriseus]MBB4715669.1 hypothetical protein [Streptomyces luteogriseus]
MRKLVRIGMATVGFFSCAAIYGCSAPEKPQEPESHREIARISSLSEVHAPLNRYFQTAQEDSIIVKARSRLAGQCMKRYGLPRQTELTDPVTDMIRNPVPLHLSERDAVRYGYRAPSTMVSTPSATDGNSKPRALTASERRTVDAVMNGWANTPRKQALRSYQGHPVSRTGCIGESDARLMAHTTRPRINGDQEVTSSTEIMNLVLNLKSRAAEKVEGDPRYRAMVSSWASCMRKSGHPYDTPSDARTAASETAPTASGTLSEQERKIARSDASCQQKVNYLGVTGHLVERYQEKIVEEYRDTMADVRKNIDQRVAKAKKINERAA